MYSIKRFRGTERKREYFVYKKDHPDVSSDVKKFTFFFCHKKCCRKVSFVLSCGVIFNKKYVYLYKYLCVCVSKDIVRITGYYKIQNP